MIHKMLEFEWDQFVEAKKRELRGETWTFNSKAMIFADGNLIGGTEKFLEWADKEFQYADYRPLPLYDTLAEEQYKSFLSDKKHDFVFLDISIGSTPHGRIVIELFSDKVPKTCANFRCLCSGENGESKESGYRLCYLSTLMHRVVPNGWIQGGDLWLKRGNGGESVYGKTFEDENFSIPHDRRGIVGMANKGKHTNGSQFYITLKPANWMNNKCVAFGQVIEGTKTIEAIENLKTENERPLENVSVTSCGICTYEF